MGKMLALAVLTVSAVGGFGLAADKVAKPPAKEVPVVTVLDTNSVWRIYQTLKPPVIAMDNGPTPVTTPLAWLNRDTAEAPTGWTSVDFDDTAWLRGTARAFAMTSYLSRLCLRGQFEVTDPSAVKGLTLSLAYYGGAIVSVNGQEFYRSHVAQSGRVALAEGYPAEAFLTEKGDIVPSGWQAARHKKAMAARMRKVADVAIPAKLLRKGVNVLAIEIVRAPYHKVVDEKKGPQVDKRRRIDKGTPYNLSWNTCEVRSIKLVARSVGLVPNAVRPKGLQIWNGEFLTPDYESDLGDRCEPLRPIAIRGTRGGWFSGKVVVGSDQPIAGLKATCSDLKQGSSTLPASAVRVRYGLAWGGRVANNSGAARYGAPLLDALLEAPLEEFKGGKYGTVVPIWVTVKVPQDAKAGVYTGELQIAAKGETVRRVPVRLEVADWALPEAQDWRTWVDLMQSPDTLAIEYNVPLWSEKHWQLIDRSLRYIGETGCGVIHVPLICHTNSGNAQSMVRWIQKDDGSAEYDFTILDRYLDLAAKYISQPKQVVFTAWEIYLKAPENEIIIKKNDSNYVKMEKRWKAARWALRGKGPAVTTLDPATGKTDLAYLPRFDDPAAKALWRPLFDALRERLKTRGWQDAMMLGMASDAWPTKGELTTLQEVSGGVPWVMHTHGGNRVGQKMLGIAPVGYIAYVWNVKYGPDPSQGRVYGWKQNDLMVQFRRFQALNTMPAAGLLHFQEINITGHQRGIGRIGADFWAPIKDKRGKRSGHVWERYPQSLWHSLNLSSHMLVPGPRGPVASTRYEVFRQGMQQCEARIAIERALTDETLKAKLGAELAERCQRLLDERMVDVWRAGSGLQLTGRSYASVPFTGDSYGGLAGHIWYIGSAWQDRTQALYATAGEVARKLAKD